MKKLLILATLAAGMVASPVQANKVKKLDVSAPPGFDRAPRIVVYSTDGEKYQAVDKTKTLKAKANVIARCKYGNSFTYADKAYHGELTMPGYAAVGETDPSQGTLIWTSDWAQRTFRFATGEGQPVDPVEACNTELTKRLAQQPGLTRYELMAKGFRIQYPAALNVKYSFHCKPTGLGFEDFAARSTSINAVIDCTPSAKAAEKAEAAKPKPKPKRAQVVALIKSVSFEADPKVQYGKCPTSVSFKGSITVNRPGTVRYRYISEKGSKSPLFTLTFDKAGSKATRKWSRTVKAPDPSSRLSAGEGSSQFEYSGYYRLVVESPEGGPSAKAAYKIDCDALPQVRIGTINKDLQ